MILGLKTREQELCASSGRNDCGETGKREDSARCGVEGAGLRRKFRLEPSTRVYLKGKAGEIRIE